MGRKNSPSAKKELTEIIQRYEAAKAEKRQLYLDGDQLVEFAFGGIPIGNISELVAIQV